MLVGDSDRVILITGSRTGIGEKLVEYYISKGLNVVVFSQPKKMAIINIICL